MDANPTPSTGGIGFLGLLTLLFVALKFTGHLAWSWWWVLGPLWLPLVLLLALAILVVIGVLLASLWGHQ